MSATRVRCDLWTYPSVEAGNTVHEVDQTSEKTTESTGSRRGGEEKGDSQVDLVSLVPLGEVELHTGEETGFGDTEEKTGDEETVEVFDETHSDHHDTPCNHDGGDPH